MAEKKKVTEEQLDKVNGGYIYFDGDKYNVVDIRGAIVKKADNYNEAFDTCTKYNLRCRDIYWKEIEEQRQWWEEEKKEGATDEEFEMYFYGRVLNGELL